MVRPAMEPMRELAPSELMPQMSDTMTSGTTSSFNDAMKILPTTSNKPSIKPFSMNACSPPAGSSAPISHSSREPRAIPATMASKMRLVRDMLFLAGFRVPSGHGHIGAGITG